MSITLYIGPMFSGKTSELVKKYEEGTTIALQKDIGARFSQDHIVTHTGLRIPAKTVTELDYDMNLTGIHRVLIDEGQFFETSLVDACNIYAQKGVHVYVAALNGSSEKEPWEAISKLLPHCDSIVHLQATLCMECRSKPAPFTFYTVYEKRTKVAVGGAERYIPVCRECWDKKTYGNN